MARNVADSFNHRQTQRVRHADQRDEHRDGDQRDQKHQHRVDDGLPLCALRHGTGDGHGGVIRKYVLNLVEHVTQGDAGRLGIHTHEQHVAGRGDVAVVEMAGVDEGDGIIVGRDAAVIGLHRLETH